MNEIEFLEALNDMDDDLILDAGRPVPKKPAIPGLLAKAAVVAAILCMLSVTVMAVSFSIRIITGEDRVPIHEFDFGGIYSPTSKVTTVEYDLKVQNISLPSQWINTLTEAWESFDYDRAYFKPVDLKTPSGSRLNFGGISRIEDILHMELVSSPELEEVIRAAFVSLVITDDQRATEEYGRTGQITPDGLIVYLPLRKGDDHGIDSEIVEFCGIRIFIPLTETFAEDYCSHVVLSGVGEQDLRRSNYRSGGNIDTVILTNTPGIGDEPLNTFAAWEHRGVGYLLELKTHYTTRTDPVQLIRPYLEHLED